jgi:hypothetical protein
MTLCGNKTSTILKTFLCVLSLIVINGCVSMRRHDASRISCKELIELLGIQQWVVPLPKDDRVEWAFEIRDANPDLELEAVGNDAWMDARLFAKITFMPLGKKNNLYRFWLKQRNGTSSGTKRIDICDEPDNLNFNCPVQFEIEWYPCAKRVAEGKTYLIGEIRDSANPLRKRFMVLSLTMFRLEEMPPGTLSVGESRK